METREHDTYPFRQPSFNSPLHIAHEAGTMAGLRRGGGIYKKKMTSRTRTIKKRNLAMQSGSLMHCTTKPYKLWDASKRRAFAKKQTNKRVRKTHYRDGEQFVTPGAYRKAYAYHWSIW